MDRVRAALRGDGPRRESGAPPPAPPAFDEDLVRLVDQTADLVERFLAKATDAGAHVHRATRATLSECVRDILDEIGCESVTVSAAGPARADILAAAREAGCVVIDERARPALDAHYEADAGITDVEAALAESGTIIVSSGPGRNRGSFLVPPVHVAVLQAGDILPDMIDYWRRRPEGGALPAATVFITGPSKTADIEGILVTGVHGPRAVHVVIVA